MKYWPTGALSFRPTPLGCLLAVLIASAPFSSSIRTTTAQAPTVLNSCQTITQSGSYQLGQNITAPANQICFSIRASNVTFDGNGKIITANGAEALEVADFGYGPYSNITIANFTSNDGVRAYGDLNHHITFDHLTVSSIVDYASDDVSITYNTVGEGGININNADNASWFPFRPIIDHNTISGGSTDVKTLLEVVGGAVHPCPRVDAVITNNTVTNTRNDPPPEATASVRIRCATHTTFTNNAIHSTGTTIGLYMRDEADDGLIEHNTFWVNTQEALRMATGNVDKTWPARNLIRDNIFRSDTGKGFYIQGIGSGNVFSYNTFWSADASDMIQGAWGNTFDHNTFVVTSPNTHVITYDYDNQDTPDVWTNNIFDYGGTDVFNFDGFNGTRWSGNYNLYHNRSGSVAFGWMGGSLAAWRTSTGDDAQALTTDPLFTNATGGDFTLQAASSARGAGSSGTDIGAKPYGSSPPSYCYESWQCGSWSACSNGTQTRTCTDANSCGTIITRPPLTQSCTVADAAPPSALGDLSAH